MLDETIITETPPLYAGYGHVGQQVRVPVTGSRAKRILHGTINIHTGDVLLLITTEWAQEEHQAYLPMIRAHWRGWNIVLFEDKASQHKGAAQPAVGQAAGDRGPVVTQGNAGVERDGPPVATREAGDAGQSTAATD